MKPLVITITCFDGIHTKAGMQQGKEYRIGRAVKQETDPYDAYTGARLALDRLFGKEDEKKEEEKKEGTRLFQVGDRVRVVNPILNVGYIAGDTAVVTRVSANILDCKFLRLPTPITVYREEVVHA